MLVSKKREGVLLRMLKHESESGVTSSVGNARHQRSLVKKECGQPQGQISGHMRLAAAVWSADIGKPWPIPLCRKRRGKCSLRKVLCCGRALVSF